MPKNIVTIIAIILVGVGTTRCGGGTIGTGVVPPSLNFQPPGSPIERAIENQTSDETTDDEECAKKHCPD